MDAKSAFLNGNLNKEIYMKIPQGVEAGKDEVWLLHRSLYGLKQASREWYKWVWERLEEMGFIQSDSDRGVFVKFTEGLMIVAVYVDDFLIFSPDYKLVRWVKKSLSKRFEMTDLGDARWILQMSIERKCLDTGERMLSISQERYIEEILEHHGMANCNPAKTPMIANQQLPVLNKPHPDVNVNEYQRCIGGLMYLMVCTCPDIAYAIGILLHHIAAPGPEHVTAVKQVFQYLRETSSYRLEYV